MGDGGSGTRSNNRFISSQNDADWHWNPKVILANTYWR
jgi:hypothetical protein